MTHKQGWKVCYVAGLIPLTIGLYGYTTAFVLSTLIHTSDPFRVLWQTTSFSMDSLSGFDAQAGVLLGVATLCFWQLLIVFGTMVCTLSYFGVQRGQKWAWWFLLFALLWAAGHDIAAAIYLYARDVMTIPTPAVVELLGLTGLVLSRDILKSGYAPAP